MTQRRLVLVFLGVALVSGALFLWRDGGERLAREGSPRPGVEPALDGAARSLDAGVDRAVTGGGEARRALVEVPEDGPRESADSLATNSGLAALTGRVVDAGGQPIQGAIVLATQGPTAMTRPWTKAQPVTTDALGLFRAELRAGPIRLDISAAGFVPATMNRLSLGAGGTTALADDIVLQRSAIVTGVVQDDTGTPLEDARVLVVGAPQQEAIRTGADGTFRLDRLERGTFTLFAEHVDHAPREIEIDASKAGQLPFLSIRLPAGDVIEGRLEGFPADQAHGWSVVAMHHRTTHGQQACENRLAVVDASGRFRLRGMAAGESWWLFAKPALGVDGLTPNRGDTDQRVSEMLTVESGARDVVLRWKAPAFVGFRVVDADTQLPIERLVVRLGAYSGRSQLQAKEERLVEYPGGLVRLAWPRDHQSGKLTLQVDSVGYASWSRRDLLVEPGQELDLGTVELTPVFRFDVTVLDARDDRPVSGAAVGWTEQDMQLAAEFAAARAAHLGDGPAPWRRRSRGYASQRIALTDEQGRVSFDGRPGFIVELTAVAPGFASAHVTDCRLPATEDAEFVVRLEPGGGIDVLALDASGEPLVGRVVQQRRSGLSPPTGFAIDPERSSRVTDFEGRARFRNLEPGGHEFRLAEDSSASSFRSSPHARASKREVGWTTAAVGLDEVSELVLTEAPFGALFGRITENGRPVAEASLGLFATSLHPSLVSFAFENGAGTASTDADGRYRIDGVEPGEYVLRVHQAELHATFAEEVVVPASQVQRDVDFGTGVIAGTVVDEQGKGVADVLVLIGVDDGGRASSFHRVNRMGVANFSQNVELRGTRNVRTTIDGAWEIRGIEPGTKLVAMTGGSGSDWQPVCSEELELSAGQRLDDVVLVAQPAGSLLVRFSGAGARRIDSTTQLTLRRTIGRQGELIGSSFQRSLGRVDALPPGTWNLRVEMHRPSERIEEREIEIVAGRTTEVDILLPD